ncbi:18491_t:CDS:2 [Racocetra persica]|uniref:18491_t:CDS:1 n=1 Tax=Racocetra persica TaxID=160502 RepID=A0ACA9M7F6_9GLOM|nr:18491_t:CDS:2 [Racocetra persica]
MVELLESMLVVTELLSSSSYPTISDISNKYWSMLKESTIIATILDPSSKLITFSTSDKDAALASLQNIMIQHKSQTKNEHKFPTLAKMACNFFAIQETSVSCEEAFSTVAESLTKVHNCLDSQTACALLCLKSWIEQGVGI